jgi:hypothetical protein
MKVPRRNLLEKVFALTRGGPHGLCLTDEFLKEGFGQPVLLYPC